MNIPQMKIELVKPPFNEMSKQQLCEHFGITYPTLRSVTQPIEKLTKSKEKRIFKGEELILIYSFVHYHKQRKVLEQIFSTKTFTKTTVSRMFV